MTSYAGLSLRSADGSPGGGAAFELRDVAPSTRSVFLHGWTTDVFQGSKVCIARGPGRPSYEDAFADGLVAANLGLDLICFMKSERLVIERRDEDSLVWWRDKADPSSIRAAVTGVLTTEFSVGEATLEVRDAEGNIRPPTPGPSLRWHESFRYFRVAQTTTNLHDAYRNAFLALECLLDHLTPQQKEGEGQWFERAMRAADGVVSIQRTLGGNDPDPVAAAVKEFYVDGRTAVAHSKASRTFILPENHESRGQLQRTLTRIGRYYVALAQAALGVQRTGGFVFPIVFKSMAPTLDRIPAFASDDPSLLGDLSVDVAPNPSGGALVPMRLVKPVEITGPFSAENRWEVGGGELSALKCIRRIVGVADGRAAYAGVLPAELVLEARDWLEARIGMRSGNRSDMRTRFAS